MDENRKHEEVQDPRVHMAGERTLLAWIRTGLSMMGFGFVIARFGMFLRELAATTASARPPSVGLSLWIGAAIVILGVAVNLAAAMQHARFLRRLSQGKPYQPSSWSLGLIVSIALAMLGIGMTAYLLLLER